MGETTHQIGAKRPTGESIQGEMTQGEITHPPHTPSSPLYTKTYLTSIHRA